MSTPPCRTLRVESLSCSERYAQRTLCADASGRRIDLLFTRLEVNRADVSPPLHYAQLYRQRTTAGFGPPRQLVLGPPGEMRMSAARGATFACEGNRLVAFAVPEASDVLRGVANVTRDGRLVWSSPRWSPVISALRNRSGCYERLGRFVSLHPYKCMFDSKLSVIRAAGRWLLFVRSNVLPGGGGRHVQLATSRDGVTWSPFRLLELPGFGTSRAQVSTTKIFSAVALALDEPGASGHDGVHSSSLTPRVVRRMSTFSRAASFVSPTARYSSAASPAPPVRHAPLASVLLAEMMRALARRASTAPSAGRTAGCGGAHQS